jgi:hypothetical protein
MEQTAVARKPGRPASVVKSVEIAEKVDPAYYAATKEAEAAGELIHALVRSVAKTGQISDPDCMTAVGFNALLMRGPKRDGNFSPWSLLRAMKRIGMWLWCLLNNGLVSVGRVLCDWEDLYIHATGIPPDLYHRRLGGPPN